MPLANISLESINEYATHQHNQSTTFKPTAIIQPSQLAQQQHAISDLTRDLNVQLQSIMNNELLVPAIQRAFNSFEHGPLSNEHNDTKILNTIATKIDAKLSHGIRILDETIQKFLDILTENTNDRMQKLLLDSIVLPCSMPVAKHTERSAKDHTNVDFEFIGGINKKKAIEVLNFLKNAGHLHENDDQNFTINKRLMETMKNINLFTAPTTIVPIFRDVFFLPRHSQISTTNCHNTLPSEHHR